MTFLILPATQQTSTARIEKLPVVTVVESLTLACSTEKTLSMQNDITNDKPEPVLI